MTECSGDDGAWDQTSSVLPSIQFHDPHHLIPPEIDHLHGNALVLTGLEGEADGARHVLEDLRGDPGLERPLELFPGIEITGEEGLADVLSAKEPGYSRLFP